MRGAIRVGTSGWHYAHWREIFYPRDLAPSAWLRHYAAQLDCVEINNSFYRLPEAASFRHWARQTPRDFRFAVKAWRLITHRKKLIDCAPQVATFMEHARGLGRRLGPVLFQLPPRWRCNSARLAEFLRVLPRGARYAFEFRDLSWHNDEVYALLAAHRAALCVFELGETRAPPVATTDFVYLRLHGPAGAYRGSYPPRALRAWAERLQAWRAEGRGAWVFFDNDEAGYAVANALALRRLVQKGAAH